MTFQSLLAAVKRIRFSREPAIWIGLAGAIATDVVTSNAFPDLTENDRAALSLIALAAGILTRFFVSPAKPAQPAA